VARVGQKLALRPIGRLGLFLGGVQLALHPLALGDVPGIVNLDAERHQQFRMPYKENHTLQFRLEAFNAPNHPNWGMPNLNILAGPVFPGQPGTDAHQSFGIVSGTSTGMRQIQLGLKYNF